MTFCGMHDSATRRGQTRLDCSAGGRPVNPRLVAMSGPLEGTVRAITDGPLSLGRDTANQIMIGDSSVSRQHCTISQVSPGMYEISDLESHNGTFVNGVQINRTSIRHGDRIRVGTSEFVFLTGQDDDA